MAASNRRHDKQSFFKYTSAAAGITILKARALRWSSPILFNDPFDIPRTAALGFSVEELFEAAITEFLAMLRSDKRPGSAVFGEVMDEVRRLRIPHPAFAEIMRLATPVAREPVRAALAEFVSAWQDIVPRLRVLCMSEVPDEVSMWAHYSDNHRGAVLEFAASDELDSAWLLARPVSYHPDPPALPGVAFWARTLLNDEDIDWIEFFRPYLYTKTPQWAHEREWRTVSLAPEGAQGLSEDLGFLSDELVSVRLGEQASVSDADAIRGLVAASYPSASVLRAIADHAARRIEFEPIGARR